MKRCLISREELAVHEAGHLVAIASMREFMPGDFVWYRLPHYEITHVEPVESGNFDWETRADRHALIVKRVVIALAGGVAVDLTAQRTRNEKISLLTIHEIVGRVDFELAHEWLTLQRYDPDQHSIELDLERLFFEVRDFLATSINQAAIFAVVGRIRQCLSEADAIGTNFLKLSAKTLLDAVAIERGCDFILRATVYNR
jgi:hypothetical protein